MLTNFLLMPQITNIGGFISVFFQLSAAFAGLRALITKKTVDIKQGRPILVVNFDVAEEFKPYGNNGSISSFREKWAEQENSDRIIYFYHSSVGDLTVNQDLAKWGNDNSESRPTTVVGPGGKPPPDRWLSQWTQYRHNYGCPTPEGTPYLYAPREQDCLETSVNALANRFKFDTLRIWGERTKTIISSSYISDQNFFAANLCKFFEDKCINDYEKTCSILSLIGGSKVINIFKLTNIANHDLTNINIFVGGQGNRTGRIVETAAEIEGMEVINQSWQMGQLRIKSLPANSSRFLIIQSGGEPLRKEDVFVESGITNKFGVSTLRKIALTSLFFTLSIFVINLNLDHTQNPSNQQRKETPWPNKSSPPPTPPPPSAPIPRA